MECELEVAEDRHPGMLDWLLKQAVALEYRDGASRFTSACATLRPSPAASSRSTPGIPSSTSAQTPPKPLAFPDLHSEGFLQALTSVAQLLKLPTDLDPSTLLKSVARRVERAIPPAPTAPSSSSSSPGSTPAPTLLQLASHFPLGFTLEDVELDAVATLLRILHVNDLRQLQTQVDRLIVEMQEYTADPKTDAKLGRVGI
mmetsp:Transcript_12285/g.16749  ORF Transcript_12285/g.16749 Transcript_12285/m.16749 type:complete len:201 (+) Transcript_12285:3-605(+)